MDVAAKFRSLREGDPCPVCRAPVKILLANAYCPARDCDRVPARVEPEKTLPLPHVINDDVWLRAGGFWTKIAGKSINGGVIDIP